MKVQMAVLRGCKANFTESEKSDRVIALSVDYSTGDKSFELNGLFISKGLRGVLEGKTISSLTWSFLSWRVLINHATGLIEQVPKEVAYYASDAVSSLTRHKSGKITDNVRIEELRRHINEFKWLLKATSDENCETGLYTLKYQLLEDLVFDLERFGCVVVLITSPFERCNVLI